MSGETNRLVKLTKKISNNFTPSEFDAILSSGEQVSCSLISGILTPSFGSAGDSGTSFSIPYYYEY